MKMTIALLAGVLSTGALAQSKLNKFNPELSVNALMSYQQSTKDIDEDGVKLDEVELGFASDVDAYFRAKVYLGIHEKHHEEAEAEDHQAEEAEHQEEKDEHGYALDVEEAYVETLAIPKVTLVIGKSYVPFGKHNTLHKHVFPFINAPLINTNVFGDEGLNEVGLTAKYLMPLSWYSEFSLGHLGGKNEKVFGGTNKGKGAQLARFVNLFDLTDSATLELGLSYSKGKNSVSEQTKLSGADVTFKWKPSASSIARSIVYNVEYLKMERELATGEQTQSGVSSYLEYQLSKRLFAKYRYDFIGLDKDDVTKSQRHTAMLAFKNSEFSSIRGQYEVIDSKEASEEKRFTLQLNLSFGAHPAHAY